MTINIQLQTRAGAYVGEVSILRMEPLPEILLWEDRYFVLHNHEAGHMPVYHEAFAVVAYQPNALQVMS